MSSPQFPRSIVWNEANTSISIVDQTLLPRTHTEIELSRVEDVYEAIKSLRVRGAPAIGIAAAYGLYLAVVKARPATLAAAAKLLDEHHAYLASSRPTAVNLRWALDRLKTRFEASKTSLDARLAELKHEADTIRDEDFETNRRLGEYGLSLLRSGSGFLTHCNAGALATSGWGTALAPFYLAKERGWDFHVYADETRPLLQGARLTAWELHEAGIPVTLLCDNMAASLMASGNIQAVLVGCDRVAANGDTANKIGTLGVAILAKHFGIPFYVFAPTSTIDASIVNGSEIPIEHRSGKEVSDLWYKAPLAPSGIEVYNPAFDVTPADLISAIVTEKGILNAPYSEGIAGLFRGKR